MPVTTIPHAPAAVPIVHLPRQFNGATLATVIAGVVRNCGRGLPPRIVFDFGTLAFIRPVGVAFLSNLVRWLGAQGCEVGFRNTAGNSAALRYLDDSLFFEQHAGAKLSPHAAPRATTKPLRFVMRDEVHSWLRMDLVPWLAARLGMTEASLHEFQTCVSELFNNIADHSTLQIGSIFVQHFPQLDCIHIAVSDFGVGIPAAVRRVAPGLSDAGAVIQAVEEGFTSRSTPRNRGAGLDYLLRVVASENKGEVTIFSLNAVVAFSDDGTGVIPRVLADRGFCPGTTIDIKLRTDTIRRLAEVREELEW